MLIILTYPMVAVLVIVTDVANIDLSPVQIDVYILQHLKQLKSIYVDCGLWRHEMLHIQ